MTTPNRSVEAFAIYKLKSERLRKTIPGLKLPRGRLQELLENLPGMLVSPVDTKSDIVVYKDYATGNIVMVPNPDQLQIPYNDGVDGIGETPYELEQPGKAHMRSFAIRGEEFEREWTDEFDNLYSAVTLKGNNFSNPSIIKHANASTGYIPYGLQESYVIERVLKASKMLRQAGISTEYIIGMAEPKMYPWPLLRNKDSDGRNQPNQIDAHEMLPLQEYKRRLIEQHWSQLPEDVRTIEALNDLHEKFKDMTFYVTARATDTELRVADLTHSREKFFAHFNKISESPDMELPDVDPSNIKHVDDYFSGYLMPMLGSNFARLHHLGLAHHFAHAGNLTAYGGIVDLDSIRGEALGLGDDPVAYKDMALDIANVITGVWQVHMNILEDLNASDRELANNKNGIARFVVQYMAETIALFGDEREAKHYLCQLLLDMNRQDFKGDIAKALWPQVLEQAIGVYMVYFLKLDIDEVIRQFEREMDKVHEVFHEPDVRQLLTRRIIEDIKNHETTITSMLAIDITQEYAATGDVDIVKLLFSSESAAAQLLRYQLVENVTRPMMEKIVTYAYNRFLSDGVFDDDLHDATLVMKFLQTLRIDRVGNTLTKLNEILPKGPLVDVYMELGKTLGYRIPENIMKTTERTNVFGPLGKKKQCWLLNTGMPYHEIDQGLRKDIRIEHKELKPVPESSTQFIVGPVEPGYRVTQIVTDGNVEHVKAHDEPDVVTTLQFQAGREPITIVVAEENDHGERRIYRYSSVEAMLEFLNTIVKVADSRREPDMPLFELDDESI